MKYISDLKKELENQFDLICFEDLANFYNNHGSIFHLLDVLHKSYYAPNQRLIFYTSEKLDQDYVNHLQRAIAQVDISNFFVLFCTPNDINSLLYNANKKHGYDTQYIQNYIVDIEKTKKLTSKGYLNTESLCAFPFMSSVISRTGKVSPCCKFATSIGTITKVNTINDVFYNTEHENLRNKFKNNQRPAECQICWDREKNNCSSHRTYSLLKYQQQLDRVWIDSPQPTSINLNPSIICNFKCRICDKHKSSAIAAEELKYSKSNEQYQIIKTDLDSSTLTFDSIKKSIDSVDVLSYVHILGGEPFLWPELNEFIDLLITQNKAKNCTIEFNTNGSVYPEEILDKCSKFKSCEILFSIDNTDSRFEVERGGKWENILLNLEKFNNLDSNKFKLTITPTINLQNLLYLDKIQQLADDFKMEIIWWYLESPEFLSIDNISEEMQKAVLKKYKNTKNSEIEKICQRISSIKPVYNKEFFDYTLKLDRRRKTKFSDSHSEVLTLMNNQPIL